MPYCLLSMFFVMGHGSGDEGKKDFAHIKSRQHRPHRVRTLQNVVSGELGAKYLVKHLPDTSHMVRKAVDGGGGVVLCPTHLPCGRRLLQRCGAVGRCTCLGQRRSTSLPI